jgi:hypothetical protein
MVAPPPRARAPGFSRRLAGVLSYVINPLALPPVGFAIILWHFGASGAEVVTVTAVAALFFTLLPLGYLVWMVRQGSAETLEVRQRERRAKPFLVGIGFYLVGVAVMAAVGETAQALLISLALIYPLNTAVVVLITLRWKISVHMIGLAGFISVLLFASLLVSDALPPREGSLLAAATVLPLLVLVPVLMWARVHAGAHTWREVTAGAVFGLVVPYVELALIVRALGLA